MPAPVHAILFDLDGTLIDRYPGALGEGLHDGVREMLDQLRAAGLRLGAVTRKGRDVWELTRRALPTGSFQVVVTADDAAGPGPDPARLRAAAEALGLSPSSAVYVGGSLAELEAGRRAGMRIAAALWPRMAPGERERFFELTHPLHPDWTPDRPAELTRAFARWC